MRFSFHVNRTSRRWSYWLAGLGGLVVGLACGEAPPTDLNLDSDSGDSDDANDSDSIDATDAATAHRFGQMIAVESPLEDQAHMYAIRYRNDGATVVGGFVRAGEHGLRHVNSDELERHTLGTQWIAMGDIDEDGDDELIGVNIEESGLRSDDDSTADLPPPTNIARIRYWNVPDYATPISSQPSHLSRVSIPWGRKICKIAVGRFRPDEGPGIAILLNSSRGELDTRNDIVIAFRDLDVPRFTTKRSFNDEPLVEGSKDGPCLDFLVYGFKKKWGDRGISSYEPPEFEDMDGILTPSGHLVEVSEKDGFRHSRQLWNAGLITQAFERPIDGLRMQFGAFHEDDVFDIALLAWSDRDGHLGSEGMLSIQRVEKIDRDQSVSYTYNTQLKDAAPRALLTGSSAKSGSPSIIVGFASGSIEEFPTSLLSEQAYHVPGILGDPASLDDDSSTSTQDERVSDLAILEPYEGSERKLVASGVGRKGLRVFGLQAKGSHE